MKNAGQNESGWEQHFLLFRKALAKLSVAVDILKPNEEENLELEEVDDLLREGLIKRFEYTHEHAWTLMKEYALYLENKTVKGPKDSTLEGLKMGLIVDADGWMSMLASRHEITRMYDEESTAVLFQKILESYYLLLLIFEEKMEGLLSEMKRWHL